MPEVLDYSAGWPRTLTWRDKSGAVHKAVGVVRYIGTPGRPKNLTPAEVAHHLAAGAAIGLVYEGGAGWMLGGHAAGVAAARASAADAAACGVQVRCVYFAADFDVTDAGQLAAIDACLDGAAEVLGRGRVGVYGEADVIDHCLSRGKAAYGWQTRAWSGGRTSARACLRQEIGYVYPDGVQADRNTVLTDDWGQWPREEIDVPLTNDDAALLWGYGIRNPESGVVQAAGKRLLDANDDSVVKEVAGDVAALGEVVTGVAADLAAVKAGQDAILAKLELLTTTGGQDPVALAAAVAPHLFVRATDGGA